MSTKFPFSYGSLSLVWHVPPGPIKAKREATVFNLKNHRISVQNRMHFWNTGIELLCPPPPGVSIAENPWHHAFSRATLEKIWWRKLVSSVSSWGDWEHEMHFYVFIIRRFYSVSSYMLPVEEKYEYIYIYKRNIPSKSVKYFK